MKTFQDYIDSVKRNNPDMVGRKLTLHWESLERLMQNSYRQGREDALEPIRDSDDSVPDFFKTFFRKK
jgi:hypothetical protein